VLYGWKLKKSAGRLYVVGTLPCGKEWETSTVWNLVSAGDKYLAITDNSIYYLYW
jgi:uncharacterized protein (DUF2147 family)